jgi:hypothetical protein
MSASGLPKTLAELLKSVGYNHAPFQIGTWGPIHGRGPVRYVQVVLYGKHLSFGVLGIRYINHATPSAIFNDKIQDAAQQTLTALCKAIHQDLHDKKVKRREEKYTQTIEDLQAWDRVQEKKY